MLQDLSSPLAALAAALSLAGCMTSVSVKKVETGTEPGLRYSLPQPFLVVTPRADGTLNVRWEHLADTTQQYAVVADSFLASHSLSIKTSRGLLQEVNWNGEGAAVAAELAKAAGEIQKQKIESEAQAKKEAQETADKLQQSYDQAFLDYQVALAHLSAVEETHGEGSPEYIAAKIDLAEAEAKYQHYKDLLDAGDGEAFDAASDDKEQPNPGVTMGKRHGPVWFRLQECAQSNVLQLVAVEFPGAQSGAQDVFDVYSVPEKPEGAKPKDPEPKQVAFALKSAVVKTADLAKEQALEVKSEIKDPSHFTLTGPDGKAVADGVQAPKYDATTRILTFKLKPELTAGDYNLSFNAKTLSDKTISGSIAIKVVPN